MSQTTDLHVGKSRALAAGIRQHRERLAAKGISLEKLDELTACADRVEEASKKCDVLRAECSAQVKQTNELLDALKQNYSQYRMAIRNNFPQEQWIEFGLQDKR